MKQSWLLTLLVVSLAAPCFVAVYSASAQVMKVKTVRGDVFDGYPIIVISNELVLVSPGAPTSRVAVASIASTEYTTVDDNNPFIRFPKARLMRPGGKKETIEVQGFRDGKLLLTQERLGGNWKMPRASAQLYPKDFEIVVFEDNMRAWLAAFEGPKSGGVPEDVMSGIRAKAQREWPGDYAMQKYEIDRQVKAYRAIHGD